MSNNIGVTDNYQIISAQEETESKEDSSSLDVKFNLIEYALGNLKYRKHFFKLNNLQNYSGKEETYHSLFIHSDEVKEYISKNNGSIEGYAGCVGAHEIVIDIDCKANLDESQKITQDILQKIESQYEVDLKSLRVNFSGSKGFHIRIPAVLFDNFEPSENIPAQIRSIVEEIT